MKLLALPEQVTEVLKKVEAKISDFWWIILLAAVALLIILFIVIACKNSRIRKLKRELKNTRIELETERSRAKNAETFTPVTGEKLFDVNGSEDEESETDKVEFDEEEEPAPEEKKASQKEEEVRPMPKLTYYDRATEVTQKGGNAKFIVKYDRAKDSWVVKREGMDRAVRRVDTKEEALSIARSLCRKNNASLVVHKKDGKFQKQ